MEASWFVNHNNNRWQLNLMPYSSLFINDTNSLDTIVKPIIEYFQPKSKLKDVLSIKNIKDEFEEITSHTFTAIELSNYQLRDEPMLNAKSFLKYQLKNEIQSHMETDGYLLTINTLVHDLITTVISELPVKTNDITTDILIKQLEVDFTTNKTSVIQQNKLLLRMIKKYVLTKHSNSILIFYLYPELFLSPKEQIDMKEYLYSLSKELNIFVVTSSPYFIAKDLSGINYIYNSEQLYTEQFLDDLEWESPLPYEKNELIASLLNVTKNYIDVLEIKPLISNYKQADIVVFTSIDLYVVIFMMKKLKLEYRLEIKKGSIDKPVYDYALDVYEKM